MTDKMTPTLQVISALLSYPEADIQAELSAGFQTILDDKLLTSASILENVKTFIVTREQMDLLDWQEAYVGLFDRTRNLSLHLFEHVHGESRDRGQAMIDLIALYEENGLSVTKDELPDYLPLFLEFLSTLERSVALDYLRDPVQIFRALRDRLFSRQSDYHVLFDALLAMADAYEQPVTVEEAPVDIDKEWEEEQVVFGGDSIKGATCPGECGTPCEHKETHISSTPQKGYGS